MVDYSLRQWGPARTARYLDELESRARLLTHHPELGKRRDGLHPGLFSFPHERHILYYLKDEEGITILRVLHQQMDPARHI